MEEGISSVFKFSCSQGNYATTSAVAITRKGLGQLPFSLSPPPSLSLSLSLVSQGFSHITRHTRTQARKLGLTRTQYMSAFVGAFY